MNSVTPYISQHESTIQFYREKRINLVRAHQAKRALNMTHYLEKNIDTEFSKAKDNLGTIKALINIFLVHEKQLNSMSRRSCISILFHCFFNAKLFNPLDVLIERTERLREKVAHSCGCTITPPYIKHWDGTVVYHEPKEFKITTKQLSLESLPENVQDFNERVVTKLEGIYEMIFNCYDKEFFIIRIRN